MKISFDVEFEIKFSFEYCSVNVAMQNLNCSVNVAMKNLNSCLRTESRLTDDALGQKIRLHLKS